MGECTLLIISIISKFGYCYMNNTLLIVFICKQIFILSLFFIISVQPYWYIVKEITDEIGVFSKLTIRAVESVEYLLLN